MINKALFPLLTVVFLSACVDDHVQISGCEPLGEIRPVCGMQTPEDMAALPDSRHLLLANFGGMHDSTGSLSLFDTQTETRRQLFPPEGGQLEPAGENWGDADCVAPSLALFSPHGTHLHQLADGRWRFLVVNHGGREAIELFEVQGQGEGTALAWRGCVEPAPDTFVNDVVGLSNGDLIYTRMFHNAGRVEQLLSALGRNTGDLWRWNREAGLRMLPGTEANQPNGIEISPDEQQASIAGMVGLPPEQSNAEQPNASAVWVVAFAYDDQNNIVGIRKWVADASRGFGEWLKFDFIVYSLGPSIDHVDLLTEARP